MLSRQVLALALLVLAAAFVAPPTAPSPSLCHNIRDQCDREACETACSGCPDECTVRESSPPVYTCGSRSVSAYDVCMYIQPIAPSDGAKPMPSPTSDVNRPAPSDPQVLPIVPSTTEPEQCASSIDLCDKHACFKVCSTCASTCSMSKSLPPQYTCAGSNNPPVSAFDYCPDWPKQPSESQPTMPLRPAHPTPATQEPSKDPSGRTANATVTLRPDGQAGSGQPKPTGESPTRDGGSAPYPPSGSPDPRSSSGGAPDQNGEKKEEVTTTTGGTTTTTTTTGGGGDGGAVTTMRDPQANSPTSLRSETNAEFQAGRVVSAAPSPYTGCGLLGALAVVALVLF